jgi:hypothetical protein
LGHLLAKALNTILNKGLFGVDVKRTIALLSQFGNFVNTTLKEVKLFKVSVAHIAADLSDLHLELGAIAVELEEVTSGVPLNGGHVAGFVTDQAAK